MTTTLAERSISSILDEWLSDELERNGDHGVDYFVREAAEHFKGDSEVLDAMIRDGFRVWIPVRLGRIRHLRKLAASFPNGDGPLETARARFERVIESVDGLQIPFLDLTRPQLLGIIEREDRAIFTMSQWNGLRRDVVAKMTDDEKPVRDFLDSKTFEGIWKTHFHSEPGK